METEDGDLLMERRGTQSLERALQILCLFTDDAQQKTLTEISNRTELNPSTVRRLLITLMDYGFVSQDDVTRKYRLGIRFMEFGNIVASQIDLKTEARPFIEELAELFNERVHLSIFDYQHGQTICLDMVESTYPVRMTSQIGGRGYFHCSGSGKVFAAYMSEKELSEMICRYGLPKFTETTITDELAFRRELQQIRVQGYAFDNGEHDEEIQCVAAPIWGMSNAVVATVSIALPVWRNDKEKTAKMIAAQEQTARKISRSIGCEKRDEIG